MRGKEDQSPFQPDREKPESIIQLGQSFTLFAPERSKWESGLEKHDKDFGVQSFYSSEITLLSDGLLPQLKTEILAMDMWQSVTKTFSPFSPELGYQINHEDYQLETRLQKLQRMRSNPRLKKAADKMLTAAAPLGLTTFATIKLPDPALTNTENKYVAGHYVEEHIFKPEVLPVAERLRLQLSFPNGIRLEGRPSCVDHAIMFVYCFYPMDSGEPVHPDRFQILGVALPADEKKLQQIQGRFVMSKQPQQFLKE